jgi:hypothetical protein
MATVNQIAAGVAHFYDSEVRPSISGAKAILYGVAVGMAAAKPDNLIGKYKPILKTLGVMTEDENIDVAALGAEIKNQMSKNGGNISFGIGQDVFRFNQSDVDRLMDYINRA